MNKKLRFLEKVTSLPTAPFHEDALSEFLLQFAKDHGIRTECDRAGTIRFVYKKGRCGRPLMMAAHTDHPGVEVVEAADGKARVQVMGGLFPNCFKKNRVAFEILSTAAPVPLTIKRVEKGRPVFIDVRYPKSASLQKGDWGMVKVPAFGKRKDLLSCRVFDDLAQVAALCETFRVLQEKRVNNTHVIGLFTRAEEVGFVGAADHFLKSPPPDNTVVISLECSSELPSGGALGKGVVLRLGDRLTVFSGGVGTYMSHVARELQKEKPGFQYQRRLMDGGACEGSLYSAMGFATGALALPLRNYHNNDKRRNCFGPEIINADDYLNLLDYMESLASSFSGMNAFLKSLKGLCTGSHKKLYKRLL